MADNKTAIITGAGSGVGRDTALLLAEAGYHTVLVGRTQATLDTTAADIDQQTNDVEVLVVPADLTDDAGPQQVIDATVEHFGRIDALVNNAGWAIVQPIADTDLATWRRMVDINLTAPIMLTALALPVMQSQQSGVIVNVSSLSAFDPFPGFGLYAPAKAGLTMFTHCTGNEAKKIGVKVVGIAPGAVETELLRTMFSEKMLPTEKTLDPTTIASAIRDCITGDRSFKNGETLKMPSP